MNKPTPAQQAELVARIRRAFTGLPGYIAQAIASLSHRGVSYTNCGKADIADGVTRGRCNSDPFDITLEIELRAAIYRKTGEHPNRIRDLRKYLKEKGKA